MDEIEYSEQEPLINKASSTENFNAVAEKKREREAYFHNLKDYWLNEMHEARSLEELNTWTLRMREGAGILSQHYPDMAIMWNQACDRAYLEQKNKLPEKPETLIKKNRWRTLGLAIGALALGVACTTVFPLSIGIAVGAVGLGYASVDFAKSSAKITLSEEKNIHVKEERQKDWYLSAIGFGLAIVCVAAITAVFPPAGILALSAVALAPAALSVYSRYNAYLEARERVNVASTVGSKKIAELTSYLENKNQHNVALQQGGDVLLNRFKSAEEQVLSEEDKLQQGFQRRMSEHHPKSAPIKVAEQSERVDEVDSQSEQATFGEHH